MVSSRGGRRQQQGAAMVAVMAIMAAVAAMVIMVVMAVITIIRIKICGSKQTLVVSDGTRQ